MTWNIKSFDKLTTAELYSLLQARSEVFIVEQNCPYQDIDNKDLQAMHLWAADEDQNILAYCRILPAGVSYNEPSVGRVLTSTAARKSGTGRLLMQQAMAYVETNWENPSLRISAQLYLLDFYTSLGFIQVGPEYLEDNIPHIEMLRIP